MGIDARSLQSQAQEALRKRAVNAVQQGLTQVKTACVFNVTRQAVGKWIKAFRDGGEKALDLKRRGRPIGGQLKGQQSATICNIIRDRHPEQLKLPFVLWTAGAVRNLIQRKYGIRYSIRMVQRYLKVWGYTPQKPKRRAYERDEEEVKKWLEEKYPAIRKEAKREKAGIYWGDGIGRQV